MNDLARIFKLIGIVLVLGGVGLLGYIGFTVFQILDSPDQVSFVKFALSQLRLGDRMIYGHTGPEAFEFNMSESARTIVLVFLGVVLLSIACGIAKSIITAGINLIRFASSPPGSAQPGGVSSSLSPVERG